MEKLFAVTAPGLEGVCSRELKTLGMAGVRIETGGVEFVGDLGDVYRANLWLRSASRVIVRIGEWRCTDFPELFRKTRRLPWGRFIRPGTRVEVRAASRRSRLHHTGRIAATVGEAIDRALGRPDFAPVSPEQLVLARFEEDVCLLSVDSSGPLLHRRGYREEGGHAPLRETLAAGILMLLGWDGSTPLMDPLCGSGTFIIEGALLATNQAPGGQRRFSFMNWPHYRGGFWEVLRAEAERNKEVLSVALTGSDRAPQIIAAARRNAERAGVGGQVGFYHQDLEHIQRAAEPGLVICNPPYGGRLEPNRDLTGFFRTLGRIYRQSFPGWQGAFLCPEEHLARSTGLQPDAVAALVNGGIRVKLYTAIL